MTDTQSPLGSDEDLIAELRESAKDVHGYVPYLQKLLKRAADRLSQLQSRPQDDASWVLVPREPTKEMIAAGDRALDNWRRGLDSDERMLRHVVKNGRGYHEATQEEKFAIRWKAMLSAAPSPQPEGREG